MNTNNSIEAINKACALIGGTGALARLTGVKAPTVSQWLAGVCPVPARFCPKIENAVGGKVTCEEILPDFDWEYLSLRKSENKVTEPA